MPNTTPAARREESILQEAERIINGDRADTYGAASDSFGRIASLWSAYLGTDVSADDVANLMILLKVSRTKGKFHRDSYVDIAGYSGLVEQMHQPPNPNAVKQGLGWDLPLPPPFSVENWGLKLRQWKYIEDVPDGVAVKDKHGIILRRKNGHDTYERLVSPYWDWWQYTEYIGHGPYVEYPRGGTRD